MAGLWEGRRILTDYLLSINLLGSDQQDQDEMEVARPFTDKDVWLRKPSENLPP